MKNVVFLVLALAAFQANAQDSTAKAVKPKKDWSKLNIANRPKDHFLIQLGYNNWTQMPDSIKTKGIPRTFNFYLMLDFPFKTDPRISVALGAGIATDNVYFSKTYIDITGKYKNELTFRNQADTSHFKKYKLTTAYLEAPLELRFTKDPENPNKSFKAALGVKVGTLLSAGTKGKTFQSSTGATLNAYTSKEKAKRFFNSSRISAMARIGYGIVSLYASYQLNAFVKDGFGPDIRPLQVGITISGL